MNDTHLDPPDYQEPPEWYMLLEDALQDPHIPVSIVAAVSKAMEDWCSQQGEYDPGPEPVMEIPDNYFSGAEKCPHDKNWGHCDACDHLSDIAFDAARENRLFR
jgi:hypothetical protein